MAVSWLTGLQQITKYPIYLMKMKTIKNMRELELMQKNLEYKQLISEKKLLGTSANIINDFSESLKDWAFEFGIALVTRLFFNSKRKKTSEDD